MADALVPPPIGKPDIVVPDAAPLIHLASADQLHLLHEVGAAAVVVDMVAHEITRDASKPGAAILAAWLADGCAPGSNRPVRVEETETGRLYATVLETKPDYRLRNGGETAIVERLAERVAGTDRAVIVLDENGRVPTIVRNQSLDADIDVLTTRAFLEGLDQRRHAGRTGEPGDAGQSHWDRVGAGSPTADPRLQISSQRRTPG